MQLCKSLIIKTLQFIMSIAIFSENACLPNRHGDIGISRRHKLLTANLPTAH
jgi:hypothetical protein